MKKEVFCINCKYATESLECIKFPVMDYVMGIKYQRCCYEINTNGVCSRHEKREKNEKN